MTVRDFVQEILLNAPNLDADIHIYNMTDNKDCIEFIIDKNINYGKHDLVIEIEKYE